jgi:hypothetical protein
MPLRHVTGGTGEQVGDVERLGLAGQGQIDGLIDLFGHDCAHLGHEVFLLAHGFGGGGIGLIVQVATKAQQRHHRHDHEHQDPLARRRWDGCFPLGLVHM